MRSGDISAQWWQVFRSRALNKLIDDGINNNADLKAAVARLNEKETKRHTMATEG